MNALMLPILLVFINILSWVTTISITFLVIVWALNLMFGVSF